MIRSEICPHCSCPATLLLPPYWGGVWSDGLCLTCVSELAVTFDRLVWPKDVEGEAADHAVDA